MKKNVIIAGLSVATGLLVGGASVSANTVTVKQGDTVSKIAVDNGTTVKAITNQNSLDNPSLIYVGDQLVVSLQKEHYSSTKASAVQSTQSTQTAKPTQSTKSTQSTQQSETTANNEVESQSGTLSDSEAQAVANQMASRTGQSASYWRAIMWRESNNQVHAANPSSSARGLFQLLYGGEGDVQSQIDNAVKLYEKQGTQAWALD